MAKMLETNTVITNCALADNAIANYGLTAFTEMLKVPTSHSCPP